MQHLLKKIFLSLLGVVILIVVVLFYVSPKKTSPFLDKQGNKLANSITEIRDIELGGVAQRIVIRGKDLANPILLHLHGGPGSPDRAFIQKQNAHLEDIFTVCYWDERGAGASYSNNIAAGSMTIDQIVDDGLQLTSYLLQSFNKEKVYVQAHSWGTVLGTHMIKKSPELFHAYFGIGQIAHPKRSEQLSYDFTLDQATLAGDKEAIGQLTEIGRPPYQTDKEWLTNLWVERRLMKKYELPKQKKSISMLDIYLTFVFYEEYSIQDKLNALQGDGYSMKHLWLEVLELNLFQTHTQFEIPVYIFQGKHDQTTVTSLAKSYFDSITAPTKKYFSFEKSAHSPYLEEYQNYKTAVQSILEME